MAFVRFQLPSPSHVLRFNIVTSSYRKLRPECELLIGRCASSSIYYYIAMEVQPE